jgi:hypothetical protein
MQRRVDLIVAWSVFTLAAGGSSTYAQSPVFHIAGSASEAASTMNGAAVTPTVGPAGFTGTLVVKGAGRVSYESMQNGSGVAFGTGGQQRSNTAFYSFTGAGVGDLFGSPSGEVSFLWKSRYTFAERKALPPYNYRTAFDVNDSVNGRRFAVFVEAGSKLIFRWQAGSVRGSYSVPAGTEDALFGKGVVLHVRLRWTQTSREFYLNGAKAGSVSTTAVAATWGAASNFTIGAFSQANGAGYYSSDDAVSDFRVYSSDAPPAGGGAVTAQIATPANGSTVSGSVALTAAPVAGLAAVQWQINGANVGGEVTAAPYTRTWDTTKNLNGTAAANGTYIVTAVARSTSGMTAASSVTVSVANAAVAAPPATPSGLSASGITNSSLTLRWTAPAGPAPAGYRLYRNGSLYTSTPATSFSEVSLSAATTYSYQISAYGAGGESLLSNPLTVRTNGASQRVLRAGPGKPFATPCAAIAAAAADDLIEIDAGVYTANACRIDKPNLTLRGVGGRAKLNAAGASYGGKAIWVINTTGTTTIENVEFTGATVADRNGAGIRLERGSLVLRNCYFHHNQMGLLTNYDPSAQVLIENSEFAYNGYGDGQSHNIYIGEIAKFTMKFSMSHHSIGGQMVKSRAAENYILYNRLVDQAGSSNYEIDLSNAGRSYVIGNIIQQSAGSTNPILLSYGAEGQKAGRSSELFVVNNTFVNSKATGYFIVAGTWVTQPSVIRNNIFSGAGTVRAPLNSVQLANCNSNIDFVNAAAYDYALKSSSLCQGIATDPGSGAGFSLKPEYEHQQPLSGKARVTAADAGALESQ